MKNCLVGILSLAFASGCFCQGILKHVNPLIGTDGHGHTFPGAAVPFGMVQLSPDTRVEGWDACAGYHYSDRTILGFSHTHLSGTGVADYGDILLFPAVGEPNSAQHKSAFSHQTESASPGYYAVILQDFDIKAELTTTKRVGVHRYTFPKSKLANIIINLRHGLGPDRVTDSYVEILGNREVVGFRRSEGWAKDQHVFFVARFGKAFTSFGVTNDDGHYADRRSARGSNVRAFVQFSTTNREPIVVKVGISSVSVEGARENLLAEMPGWSFDEVKKNAESAWGRELSKVLVEGGTAEQLTTFYTALYHSLLAPNIFNDVDGNYRGMDGNIHRASDFEMYTVFSLWDTFRAVHPLFTIIDQKRTLDFVKSLIAKYDESSVLPVWELAANETWCMIGYHSVSVIADASVKGIRSFDQEKAFAAMKHSATLNHNGLQHYRACGYVPGEKESESVSKTLEYAYDDWCIAQMAKALKKPDDHAVFARRAQSYRNVFDASSGFMRPKDNGSWVQSFDPTAVTVHYTEANAWQYNFFVPHDVSGLKELHGGNEAFARALDALFSGSSDMRGRKQADITGLIGQYAQGNEPSHHVAYLYNYAGKPWKTQAVVRLIMDSLFSSRPDGLCGNDDCGQMSAWYVMSALGFYQVCPGQPTYTIGNPLFRRATIRLENGRRFTIRAEGNSKVNRYIQSATLNGNPHSKSYFTHQDLLNGGTLMLSMGANPNLRWGSGEHDIPQSLPSDPIVTVPFADATKKSFSDSITIRLSCNTDGAEIHYTLNGESPTIQSPKYSIPLILKNAATIKALAIKAGLGSSEVMMATFTKQQRVGAIRLQSRYSHQYAGGGDDALIDGLRGGTDFRLGSWQGYERDDLDAIVDIGATKELNRVALSCLQDNNSWIFFPTEVEFSFSEDGKEFGGNVRIVNDVSPQASDVRIKAFQQEVRGAKARYVRVRAKNIGICPPWHRGAGNKAWLFVDEITIE